MKWKVFLIALFSVPSSVLAGPTDHLAVISPGKTMYFYVDNGEVIGRQCEDYKVVKSLSDCKNKVEMRYGTASELKKRYAQYQVLLISERDSAYYEEKKRLNEIELKKMEEFKKAYGDPKLSMDLDPIIDQRKYQSLNNDLSQLEVVKKVEDEALKEASQILSQIESNSLDVSRVENSNFLKLLISKELSHNLKNLMRNENFQIGKCTATWNNGIYSIENKDLELTSKTTIPHKYLKHTVQSKHTNDMINALTQAKCEANLFMATERQVDPTKEVAIVDSNRSEIKEITSEKTTSKENKKRVKKQ